MKKNELNETFNEIILEIASGTNYVSELAKKIGKSIPVTFRQLEELTKLGVLTKERKGKRVEYFIQWDFVAKELAEFVEEEFSNAKKALLPNVTIEPLKELEKIFKSLFDIHYIRNIFEETYKEIEKAGKISYEYTKTKFNDALGIFLDAFGELNESQEKKILEKIPKEKQKDFKKFNELSERHKKIEEEINPRKKIIGLMD